MRTTLALVALLAASLTGCGAGGDSQTLTLDELHSAAVEAGLECKSFNEVDDQLFVNSDIVAMGGCGMFPDDTMLTVYSDSAAARAGTKEPLGPPQLLGANWVIRGDTAPDLAADLDGEVIPALDGYDEARACEFQVRTMLTGWATGAGDSDPNMLAAVREATSTGSPAVTIASQVMSRDVASNVPMVGAESAVAMGMVSTANMCRGHYIDGFGGNGTDSSSADGDLGGVVLEEPEANDELETVEGSEVTPSPTATLDSEDPAGGEVSCEEVAPDLVDDPAGCAGAVALLARCNGVVAPVSVVSRERAGILTYESSADQETVAVTSQDSSTGDLAVLSCGYPENGVDVEAVYDAVVASAERDWGITASEVSCGMTGGSTELFDTVAPGPSVGYCSVMSGDGAGSPAFVTITNKAPFFRIDLGE